MYTFYQFDNQTLQAVSAQAAKTDPSTIVWIDLLEPTTEEETFVEQLYGINIPTSDEMHEIELSNRLYQENGALYATFSMVTKTDTPLPEMASLTFVLTGNTLISVRYSDPRPFRAMQGRLSKVGMCSGVIVLTELMESIVNRMADILEAIGHQMDGMTRTIFYDKENKKLDFDEILRHVGLNGDAVSKTRESLVSLNRMGGFLLHMAPFSPPLEHDRMRTILHDIAALSDHANFLSSKVNFLLDATLGMVNLEQNSIIKIVSVGTIVLMPPTLVASIYGMNFALIPELHWTYGYPIALGMMALAAFLPYKYFKSKGWL